MILATRSKPKRYELLYWEIVWEVLNLPMFQQGSFQLGFDAFAPKNDCPRMKSQRNERKFAT